MATPLAKMTAAAASAVTKETASALGPNFKVGGQKIYLPNITLTLVRPKVPLPPDRALFMVPLTFNKLDLRDYLWHMYNVRVTGVRSYVQEQPLQRRGPIEIRGRAFRPQARKFMIAVLEKPFVWPDRPRPEDLPVEYDWKRWKAQEDYGEEMHRRSKLQQDNDIELTTERAKEVPMREKLGEDARDLLEGRKQWKNEVQLDERWQGILEQAKRSGK